MEPAGTEERARRGDEVPGRAVRDRGASVEPRRGRAAADARVLVREPFERCASVVTRAAVRGQQRVDRVEHRAGVAEQRPLLVVERRDEHLLPDRRRPVLRESPPEIPVLDVVERLVEAAELTEHRAADDDRGAAARDDVAVPKALRKADRRRERQLVGRHERVVDHDRAGVPPVRVTERRELQRELVGRPEVVVVEERNPLGPASATPAFRASRRAARTAVAHQAHAGVVQRADPIGGPVLRAVVDDDHLDLTPC